ncbi:hypothetical protein BCF46_3576 [Litoreibacter meonggei]|uniref:Uncharacterized protein n=1 Tax=Litoreibacter meonggei TaxID=1049199 RepID=A0A497VW04_9RHOB|nr:hypothetical protein BCF46_3576 [Litoreibacter meonggei]
MNEERDTLRKLRILQKHSFEPIHDRLQPTARTNLGDLHTGASTMRGRGTALNLLR